MYSVSVSDSTHRIGIKVLQLPRLVRIKSGNMMRIRQTFQVGLIIIHSLSRRNWFNSQQTGGNYGLVSTSSPTLLNGRTHMQSITEKVELGYID